MLKHQISLKQTLSNDDIYQISETNRLISLKFGRQIYISQFNNAKKEIFSNSHKILRHSSLKVDA